MWKNILPLDEVTEWPFISMIFGSSVEKEKLPVRLLTTATVLFLILAGSPFANIDTNAANAASNPYAPDTTPPASITNLQNITYSQTYINWTWIDPSDPDFSKVMIYLDGIFMNNVSKGVQYYNIAGLTPATSYEISTRTVDLAGNANSTWVNRTSTTAPAKIFNINKGTSYSTIQSAIIAANTGDIIEVKSGIYYECVNVNKHLTLRGIDTGEGKPLVSASCSYSTILLSENEITLEGFNVSNCCYSGILVRSNNNTINNNNVTNGFTGIFLEDSENNVLIGNNISNNQASNKGDSVTTVSGRGITLSSSNNNTLRNNVISGYQYNFNFFSLLNSDFYNDIDTSNLVDGKPIYYLIGASGTIIDSSSNAGTIYCINCDNITVKDLTLSNNGNGVYCINCDNITVKDLTLSNNIYGIQFYETKNSKIQNNQISNINLYGIYLHSNNYDNIISNNTANSGLYGIYLSTGENNKLINNTVSYNRDYGIMLSSSFNSILSGNIASNNVGGIYLTGNNSMLRNNLMSGNQYNFDVHIFERSFYNDVDITNLADGKPIYYLNSASGTIIDSASNASLVYCFNCENITVKDQTIKNVSHGIVLYNTSNSTIQDNYISNVHANGIYLRFSNNNILKSNIVLNGSRGMYTYSSLNNSLIDNTVDSNFIGIYIHNFSKNNTLISNIAKSNNYYGIYLYHNSNNNNLTGNFVLNNSKGIYIESSSSNIIFNNFFNNTYNFGFSNTNGNFWNITKIPGIDIVGGPNLGGNFWANPSGSGFSQTCADADGDGICDSSYTLDANNTDYLPLSLNFTTP